MRAIPLEEFLAGEVAPEIELAPPPDDPAPQVKSVSCIVRKRSLLWCKSSKLQVADAPPHTGRDR
jgi:hypothetical protein